MKSLPKVLIVDLGSQYTKVIERTVRELGVRSMILNPKQTQKLLKSKPQLKAVILSGGGRSVNEKKAPHPPNGIFSLRLPNGQHVPKLCICYGMQWTADYFGGKVKSDPKKREYGKTDVKVDDGSRLFQGTPKKQPVWASHGDSVTKTPKGFRVIAHNNADGVAAMVDEKRNTWCTLFHPEVSHTRYGKQILKNFVFGIAGCEKDWKASSMIGDIRADVLEELGKEKVVLAFSGGVDSTTEAAIVAPVLGRRLLLVTIDGGMLRENEPAEISRHARLTNTRHIIVDARREFARALAGIIDAEEKRKRFKKVYVAILTSVARRFGAKVVLQGTLAPDVIESGAAGGELIKSHHNLGLKMPGIKQLHPMSHLFKYEVRALARKHGLPKSVWGRQPFPGPGLFLRVVGVPATREELALVRWATARVEEVLKHHKLYDKVDQLVVARVAKLVGVKGDARVYGEAIMVRAIKTLDFMTADGVRFGAKVKEEIESVLVQHPKIVAVLYNETDKPPCTTEPE